MDHTVLLVAVQKEKCLPMVDVLKRVTMTFTVFRSVTPFRLA